MLKKLCAVQNSGFIINPNVNYLNRISHSHVIESYNDESHKFLLEIALFKFGSPSALNTLFTSFLEMLNGLNEEATIIVPVTKSPLTRPIVELGKALSYELSLPILHTNHVTKHKKPDGTSYSDLTSNLQRWKRKANTIEITKEVINTPLALLVDDTIASGATFIEYARELNRTQSDVKEINAFGYAKFMKNSFHMEKIINLLPIWDLNQARSIIDHNSAVTTTSSRELLKMSPRIFKYFANSLTQESRNLLKNSWDYYRQKSYYQDKFSLLDNSDGSTITASVINAQNVNPKSYNPEDIILFEGNIDQELLDQLPIKFDSSDMVISKTETGYRAHRYLPKTKKWVMQIQAFDSLEELLRFTLLTESYEVR